VRELIEMTIGRTEDPENPVVPSAFEVDVLFGDRGTHLGQRSWHRVT
jgi:hypothetical protein